MLQDYRVVLIEDEEKIGQMIKNYLEKEGMTVYWGRDGARGKELMKDHFPDLLILDLILPDIDGLEFCRKLRHCKKSRDIPVIMLTARSQETDRVLGLETGADDYITKPFSLAELAARIRAVMRRTGNQEGEQENLREKRDKFVLRGDLEIDIDSHYVKKAKKEIILTPTEFNILSLMARHPGRVFSRLQLLESCLGEAYSGYERSIDTHIRNLRKKIEDDPAHPTRIVTVFGLGYKFIQ